MRRVGWVIVGRGDSGEAWYPFLGTAARSKGEAIRKWCADLGFRKEDGRQRRAHWKHIRKAARARAVRIYIKEDGA